MPLWHGVLSLTDILDSHTPTRFTPVMALLAVAIATFRSKATSASGSTPFPCAMSDQRPQYLWSLSLDHRNRVCAHPAHRNCAGKTCSPSFMLDGQLSGWQTSLSVRPSMQSAPCGEWLARFWFVLRDHTALHQSLAIIRRKALVFDFNRKDTFSPAAKYFLSRSRRSRRRGRMSAGAGCVLGQYPYNRIILLQPDANMIFLYWCRCILTKCVRWY